MTALFSPKRPDGKAEWRLIYESVQAMPIGAVITFDQLAAILEREPSERGPIYRAVARSTKELQRTRQRSMANVPGVGYRVLHPTEHQLQAQRYREQSRRRMRAGVEVIKATDLDLLPDNERQHTIALGMVMQGMCQAIASIDARQRRTEALLARVATNTDQRLADTDQRLNQMAQALKSAGLLEQDP